MGGRRAECSAAIIGLGDSLSIHDLGTRAPGVAVPQDAGVPGSVWLNLQVFQQCRISEPEWQSPDRTAKDRNCDEGTTWRKQNRLFLTKIEYY